MKNSNHPKVSVCVVTYNHEYYISQCLDSLITQDFDGTLEIIISDDASKDGTPMIIRDYAKRYPKLINFTLQPVNLGPCANLKYVHSLATGDYIAHVDGDDFWLPTKLNSQINELKMHPEATACFTNSIVVSDDGTEQGIFSDNSEESFSIQHLIAGRNFLQFSSILYRKPCRKNTESLPDVFIDLEFYIHLIRNGSARYIRNTLSGYRINSATSTIKSQPLTVRILYIQAINAAKLYTNPKIWSESLDKYVAYAVVEELLARRPSSVAKIIRKSNPPSLFLFAVNLSIYSLIFTMKKFAGKFRRSGRIIYKID